LIVSASHSQCRHSRT